MTLEDFKDVYKDKTPIEMLDLLAEQHATWRHDAVAREENRDSIDGGVYYANECRAMEARVEWLMGRLKAALKAQEPVKPTTKNGAYFCGNPHCRKIIAQMVPCGAPTHRVKYCSECGRKVWWE